VSEEISLEKSYGKKKSMWVWYVLGGLVGLFALGAVGVAIALSRGRRGPVESTLPTDLDAFTAAALLREIRERPELTAAQRAGIDQDIAAIERHHFAAGANGQAAPDLRAVVERWAAAAPGWSPARRAEVAAA
jgi:hypothetical protein